MYTTLIMIADHLDLLLTDEELIKYRKEKVRNLYSSGTPIGIIALKTDINVPSILSLIDEIELGELHKLCPHCSSILQRQKEIGKT